MTKYILLFCSILTAGCSSLSYEDNPFSGRFSGSAQTYNLSTGEKTDDGIAFYWLTQTNTEAQTAADYVEKNDGKWHKTSYQWKGSYLNEFKREGMEYQDGTLMSFNVHLRYSSEGEVIYQRYQIGDKILPLTEWNLNYYTQTADRIKQIFAQRKDDDAKLYQGVWQNGTFLTCDGARYNNLQYQLDDISQTVMTQLDNKTHYVAFVGKELFGNNSLTVEQIIKLGDSNQECVERPVLIED